jgi:hypothetical protein
VELEVIASASGGRAVIAQGVAGSIEISGSSGRGDRPGWGVAAGVDSGYEGRVGWRAVSIGVVVSVAEGGRIYGVVSDGERKMEGVVESLSLPQHLFERAKHTERYQNIIDMR